ncbi:negative regulator of allantoin and glyoxylate utilization operons [Escherichia coli]|uniref:HTH-type transcriptional repressor AllR n=1 Tax=Escherichia coli TaxID=562 RepID=A0A377F954_ECOLX|nr:negative regulator of allantoin and glyoxylate utilization operons [Escherichia coli]
MTEVRRRGRPGQAEPVAQKGAQALERGIAILHIWKKVGEVRRLAIFLSIWILPLSTTFRLLKVLQAADFVYQDSQLGWWHIGLGVFNVGAAYIHNRDVLSVAGPFMRRLMLLSGETVNVAIRNGNEAVLIGQLECKSMVRMCAPLGSRLPLHASGAGQSAALSAGGRGVDEHHSANRFAAVYANYACGYAHLAEGPGTSA